MKNTFIVYLFITPLICKGCKEEPKSNLVESSYEYIDPEYDQVSIEATPDSLHFLLSDHFYSSLRSFNAFSSGDSTYVSFFNKQARAIGIYDVENQRVAGYVELADSIIGKRMDNVTVFCYNFDTILVATKTKLFLIDSSGKILSSFKLFGDYLASKDLQGQKRLTTQINLDNTKPPVFKDNVLYSAIRPAYYTNRTLSAQRRTHIAYAIDLRGNKASLLYNFPRSYWEKYFGYYFIDFYFCRNDKEDFIISFSGDSNIYATDLAGISHSFTGKSNLLKGDISPLGRETDSSVVEIKHFMSSDKYGPIYFDTYRKRYLRAALQGNQGDDQTSSRKEEINQSILVFDEKFKIIGESKLPGDISLRHMFITPNGKIYARTRMRDEYRIHFVRLEYKENHLKVSKN
ncbi:DUF4221 domain-containing protein [Chitinophaga sp. SYP-B3965]|uniref:DUF4221 family protein n=1 Tax=Chitinophaga sp. SYP-B3965 TaxID=2663120 RepID=UPI0012995B8A|nr:DUF4221 family protein [Chitinophaga sp. SYP-B3965]MRG47686.1 DUF4221 domain-containing protein [Chitinophaga sp. SYP-B3965]